MRDGWPALYYVVFPRTAAAAAWVARSHAGIALCVTVPEPATALCRALGRALVSTRANPHAPPSARSAASVTSYFGDALEGVVMEALGGQFSPMLIRDAPSEVIIRP
ncbi:MAG: Sua5/YciO/YrdC/YwlC family protein [Rhodanobacter sp.]